MLTGQIEKQILVIKSQICKLYRFITRTYSFSNIQENCQQLIAKRKFAKKNFIKS